VRRRLVISIAAVAAIAVALFALPLAVALQRAYQDEDLLRLQRDAVAATRRIDIPSGGRDTVEVPRSSAALAVYDRAGRRLGGLGPPVADAVVLRAIRTSRPADTRNGDHLVVAVPLLVGERVAGAVRAARDAAGARSDTRRAWLLLAAVGGGLILLAVVAAFVLGRRLAAPLERLAGAARLLGEGNFSVRAPHSSIAEVDAVGRALDTTAARLGDLIARERAFSADASHQLRTPLAALRLELEALELRAGDTPELGAALVQVERLQATVDALLAVARDAPRRDTVADVTALADEAQTQWRAALAADGRPLRVAAVGGRALARVSPQVVREILDVLLDNAHRHGAGPVTITVRRTAGSIALDVADDGPGFGPDPEAAFARRVSGGGEGHGIGLALARSLAHAEGGRLDVTQPGPRPVVRLLLTGADGAAG
jgi:signal transduction histidine kinase